VKEPVLEKKREQVNKLRNNLCAIKELVLKKVRE
jgi:hypothetical protein